MLKMRCLAELRIHVVGTDHVEDLWPGLDVDFDRELAPGLTVAESVRGYEKCFEPVHAVEPLDAVESGE